MIAAKGNGVCGAGNGNSGDGADGGERTVHEVTQKFRLWVFGAWQADGGGNHAVGVKSWINLREQAKAGEEQARADEQGKRKSNLGGDEKLTDAT